MAPLQLWLFNEPPVTMPEIVSWTKKNDQIGPDNWRFGYYVKG